MEMNHLRVCRPPNTHMHAHDTHPHRTGSQYVHAAHITDRRCPSSTCAYYLSVFFSFFFFFSPFIAPPVNLLQLVPTTCPFFFVFCLFSLFLFFSPFIAPPVSFFNLCLLPFPFLFFSPFNCSASDLLQLVPTTFPPPFSSFSFSPLSRHGNELFFFFSWK